MGSGWGGGEGEEGPLVTRRYDLVLAIIPSPLPRASDSQIPQIRNASPHLPALHRLLRSYFSLPPAALLRHITPWLSTPCPPRPAETATPRPPSSPPKAHPRTRPPPPPRRPSTTPASMTATPRATEAHEAPRHAQCQTSRAPPPAEKAAAGTRLSSPSLPSLPFPVSPRHFSCPCLCSRPALRPRAARSRRTCRVRRKVSIIPQSSVST